MPLRCALPALLALGATAARAPLDPKDGPDVDLRVAIEDAEVRFQIITNLAFLDATCDAPREDETTLASVEEELAREELFALFKERNRVTIDGVVVPPVDAGFEVDPGDPSLVPHFPEFGARAVFKTRLTLVYPCKEPPERVGIVWGVYPDNAVLRREDGTAPPIEVLCRLAAGGVDRIVRFKEEEPEFIWHAEADAKSEHMLAVPELERVEHPPFPWVPVGGAAGALLFAFLGPRPLRRTLFGPLAIVLLAFAVVRLTAGRPPELPDAERAARIFEPLHANIYRAFDYTDDEDVYDALAQSVEGRLLDRLYDEVYRSLVMQEEGGAVSRVEEVRHLDVDVQDVGVLPPEDRPGFRVDARWQVDGAVYHWGHAHSRTNEYRAEYTVVATDAGWRIAESQVLEQRRVDAAPIPEGEF